MALKDITSKKDLIEEQERYRAKLKQDREDAIAAQKEDLRKANYLKERRVGNNIAYQQFKRSGTEDIDTEPDLLQRAFGASKDDAKYQAAREMKKALESERARVKIPDVLDEVRKSRETSLNKVIPMTNADAKAPGRKKGGRIKTKKMSSGGKVGLASKRADGCAVRGKTRA